MWRARAAVHSVQWRRLENKILGELRAMKEVGKVDEAGAGDVSDITALDQEAPGGIPRFIPPQVRAAVMAKFLAKSRDSHVIGVRNYHGSRAHFIRIKCKHARGDYQEKKEAGAISFKTRFEEYLRLYQKPLWDQRPSRPVYQYRIQERRMEEMIEDAVQLWQLEKEGVTTSELYAAGVKAFVFLEEPDDTPPGSRPASVVSMDYKLHLEEAEKPQPYGNPMASADAMAIATEHGGIAAIGLAHAGHI